MSRTRYHLTPYFLDEPLPGLKEIADPCWWQNSPSLPARSTMERLITLYSPLASFVAETTKRGKLAISIAGDCVISLAVLAGLQRARLWPTLIWFDAHGDLNTWETTPSGFLGGMPLAMALGRGEQTIVEGLGLTPIPEEKVILTDARDLDPVEREVVRESALRHLPKVEALLEMELPAGPLYVHFDCDVLDPADVPAVHYPASGGPSMATLRSVFFRLAKTEQIVAVSLSSWAPELDEDGSSRTTVMGLLQELLLGKDDREES